MVSQLFDKIAAQAASRTTVAAAVTTAVVALVGVHTAQQRKLTRKLGRFPRSSPWFFPHLDLFRAIRAGFGPTLIISRRAALGDIFYLGPFPGMKRSLLTICKPEDQAELMKKEGRMKLYAQMPDEMLATHGPGNMQIQSGKNHQFLRKIFSSLLSPTALESFVPYIVGAFTKLWTDLETKSKESDHPINIQDAICDAQFTLMCKLFFGLTPDADDADLAQMRRDFEAQMDSHFKPASSPIYKNGVEAANRIHIFLSKQFDSVLEERRKIHQSDHNAEEKKDDSGEGSMPKIGNALESIADALLRDGVANDPKAISDVKDNLNLLLEASHGTTMTITTSTMYFLNRTDNVDALDNLRQEVANLEDASYSTLRGEMPYAESCIKEAMRLAPIVGGVSFTMDEGLDVSFKGEHLKGPTTFLLAFSVNYKDESLFPEPETYEPERWIKGSTKEASAAAQLAFKPFGTGRHLCLGYQLALLVMKASLYVFAKDKRRTIKFDEESVKIENGLFPEAKVSGGLPGQVVRV